MRPTMTSAAVCARQAAGAVGAACATAAVSAVLAGRAPVLRRTNYHGRAVSLRGGVGTAAGAVMAALCAAVPRRAQVPGKTGGTRDAAALAALMSAAAGGAAGLVDDLDAGAHDGERVAKGLKGHLGALVQGRVTTGVLKVVVVGAASVAAGGALAADRQRAVAAPVGARRWAVVADAASSSVLIASWANLVNLLDLRPGRALKATGLLCLPVLLVPGKETEAARRLASGVLGVVAAALPEDLGESTMLGDTGANALGALLGTAVAAHPSREVRGGAALLGTALVLASERVSFTSVIERTPFLAALDSLGRRP